jgi:hypothetical protein
VADPIRAPRGAANLGAAGLARTGHAPGEGARWELGEVVAYNSATHTSLVRTHTGRPLQDVPQIKATAGGFDHIPVGTTVVISWDLGIPAIIGCIDMVGPTQAAIPSPTLTGVENVGDDDPTQPTEGSNSYKPPNAPTDMSSGDWAQVGALGNHVAVLEGGVSLFGSLSAHIRSIATSGIVQTVARQVQQFTDFGKLSIENYQGRTSLILRAGSNQASEVGQDEQHWTIRLDLGATGDVLDFRISEPEGKLLFRLHAGSDGRVQIYGDGGVDLSSGTNGTAEMRHDIAGDRSATIAGDDTHEVQGDHAVTVDGASVTAIAGDQTHSVGGGATSFVGGDRTSGVSGDETQTIAGKRSVQIGGDDETDVTGNSTTKAEQVLTVDGVQVKLGANAVQPVGRGLDFGSQVLTPISAAATALIAGAAASAAISGAPPGPPTTDAPALAALTSAVSAFASAVISAIAAFPATLSTKVTTE